MEPAVRDQLLERFRDYLERVNEAPTASAAEAPDLFTLLGEQAALKNEVKLESRQMKAALEQFRSLFTTLEQANARLGDELARQREREALARQEAERDLLVELLELHDRLQAGHDQAHRYRASWLARRRAAQFVASMAEGMAMILRRLDEILARRGVRPLDTLNQAFDPQTMHALGTEHHPDRPPGLVVGETRRGFLYRDRLLRPAEVTVNKETREA
jgi:molecular chaperone GrpE